MARPGHSGRATPGLMSNPEVKPAALGDAVGSARPRSAPKPGSGRYSRLIHNLSSSPFLAYAQLTLHLVVVPGFWL
ncbi:hypothetical protein PABY_16180 [Pyrodictium abyssi]|uniref:Uncharacterized protein n=1 Tax=Pyrodictium abyssi TaxID=54256 RepID=A0ABM8J047_9CREN|nr:hypothetical protein PABY_16180 [Pyrodictium abyssi]